MGQTFFEKTLPETFLEKGKVVGLGKFDMSCNQVVDAGVLFILAMPFGWLARM